MKSRDALSRETPAAINLLSNLSIIRLFVIRCRLICPQVRLRKSSKVEARVWRRETSQSTLRLKSRLETPRRNIISALFTEIIESDAQRITKIKFPLRVSCFRLWIFPSRCHLSVNCLRFLPWQFLFFFRAVFISTFFVYLRFCF